MYNEQSGGGGDFGLTPPAFVERIFDASWELAADPRTPVGF